MSLYFQIQNLFIKYYLDYISYILLIYLYKHIIYKLYKIVNLYKNV